MMKIKILYFTLALVMMGVLTIPNSNCTAAPRVDVSKTPPDGLPLTPEQIEENKKKEEKINKELEELQKKRKLEQDQNNLQEKKSAPRR